MNFGEIEHLDDARWEAMLATNLTGVFHCVRAAVPLMARHRFGRIVATASTVGRGGFSHLGHYAASKWGLIGLIKSLALEVGDRGITANVIAPATVDTPMVMNPMAYRKFRPELDDPTRDDAAEVLATWGPLGVPWLDVADTTRAMMYFVADPGHSTGTVLEVNLGLTAAKF
jgi:NAD(P)-dependent dehydrogenase (short-subunit alcohol dehydrogenase family)